MLGDLIDFLTTGENWSGRNGIIHLTWEHLRVSVVATLIAAAVAIPPAVWLGHRRRGALLAVSVVNIGRAVPTFGIVVLVLPISLRYGFGLGFWPLLVALVLLALPPVFVNTYTGVREVPDDIVDAARGMGMREREVIWQVELPSALPLLVTGVRISAVQVVATATLGALVGYRCLGTLIIGGLNERRLAGPGKLLAGAVLVGLLSLLTEVALTWVERRLSPWLRRHRPVGVDVIEIPTIHTEGQPT